MSTNIVHDWPVREIVDWQESLARGSEFFHEGARFVCHNRTTLVPTIYTILGNFYSGAGSLGDALDYLSTDLDRAVERGDVYHANGGDIAGDIAEAKAYLREARYHASELNAKLQAAQQSIAHIGHNADERRA